MNNQIQNTGTKNTLIGDKFIKWGIFLIILGPILGVLSIWYSSIFVGWFVKTDGMVEALTIVGGVSTVGIGISLVLVGCTKNIVQNIKNRN